MKIFTLRLLMFILIMSLSALTLNAQTKDLSYYFKKAQQNNPTIKQNERLREINLLQNDLIFAQNRKPQVYFTSDYLFAPYFNNNGRFISLTPNPDPNAYGYDPSISNGGLYEVLLNADVPLLNKGITNALTGQNNIQNQLLLISDRQILHDIERQVKEQYIKTYSIQELINYLDKIIKLVDDRKKLAETLAQKGIMQQSDYLLLDIEQNSRVIEQQQQRDLLTEAYTQLNNLCLIEDTTEYELAEPLIAMLQPVSSFSFLERYRADSMSLAAQQEVLKLNNNPQLNFYGNIGMRTTDPSNALHNFGTSIGLHLNVPLFNGNQKDIQIQQKMIAFDTLIISRNLQMSNVINSLKGLNRQIKLTEETVSLNQAQITKQELLLNILQEKIISGQVSVLEYVKSIEDYVLTNQNLLNARISLWQLINQYNYLNW